MRVALPAPERSFESQMLLAVIAALAAATPVSASLSNRVVHDAQVQDSLPASSRDSTALVEGDSARASGIQDTIPAVRGADSIQTPEPEATLEGNGSDRGDGPLNPFAGFHTHRLPNGVKLWIRSMPGATNTSVSVGIPFGSDQDPVGKEGTAHLLEHMLFSDHDGRTEQAIKDDIEGIGGRRNGFTTTDMTWYYATVEREHGLFALEWLSRIVSPHAMEDSLVDRNRQPVALETRAQPRELFEHIWAFLDPAWLRPEGFWKREFGMATRSIRPFDRYRTLQSIEPGDLREFYDRHYAPGAMTVTVVGDVDPTEVIAVARSTFGSLRSRPVPDRSRATVDPSRFSERHFWNFGASVSHTVRFKMFEPTGSDEVKLVFLERLLERRLNQRLRYGVEKAVYTLNVRYAKRGPAAFLGVGGSIDPDEYEFALRVLEEELDALRAGTQTDEAFATDRTAVVEQLRGTNRTSEALNFWTFRRFGDPSLYEDFPDLIGSIEQTSKAQLAEFATSILVPERTALTVTRPHPVTQAVFAATALLAAWIAIRILGWGLTRKVDLRQLRYVARMRLGPVYSIALVAVAGSLAAISARLVYAGLEWIALRYVIVQGGYEVQMASFFGMGAFALTTVILFLSIIPRKVLLFPDSILIKSLTFRSRRLEPTDVEFVTWARFPSIWLSRRLLSVTPMLFGALRKGIYIKPKNGRAYFFQTRDSQEMMELIDAWGPGLKVDRIPTPAEPSEGEPMASPRARATADTAKVSPPTSTSAAPPGKKPGWRERRRKKKEEETAASKGPSDPQTSGSNDVTGPSLDDIDLDSDLSAEDLAALGIEAPEPEPDPFADLEDMIRDLESDSQSDPPSE